MTLSHWIVFALRSTASQFLAPGVPRDKPEPAELHAASARREDLKKARRGSRERLAAKSAGGRSESMENGTIAGVDCSSAKSSSHHNFDQLSRASFEVGAGLAVAE